MNVVDVLPRDAISSVDDPTFGRSYFGDPDDEVIVVDTDPARAYPLRILGHHEIVNDALPESEAAGTVETGGRPVAVTWCPICWSGAVYDRTVDGRVLTFGVSGKLADDALVMYDRETGSEWKQPTGEAFDGELTGGRLEALPAPTVTVERFRETDPDGVVLQPPRSATAGQSLREIYDVAPYEAYADREEFGLYGMRGQGTQRTWNRDDIGAKTVVLGVEIDDTAVGYPVTEVEAAGGVVTDTVGGREIVVVTVEGAIGAFENPGYAFERREGSVRADGTTWDPVTGESADGRGLEPVGAMRAFAFAWQDAHGPESFFRRDE